MKKKLLALLLALALVVCTLPAPASAYYDKGQTVQLTAISKPAQRLKFKDNKGNAYYVESGTLVSSGSSYTGYIFVIQEVLERLLQKQVIQTWIRKAWMAFLEITQDLQLFVFRSNILGQTREMVSLVLPLGGIYTRSGVILFLSRN